MIFELEQKMFARVHGDTNRFLVKSLDDAARKYSLMRVKSAGIPLPSVDLIDEGGNVFAQISQDGRIRDAKTDKMLYDPFAKTIRA